jgi:hypothetical protein
MKLDSFCLKHPVTPDVVRVGTKRQISAIPEYFCIRTIMAVCTLVDRDTIFAFHQGYNHVLRSGTAHSNIRLTLNKFGLINY